jgi:hypothetical protein
MANFRVFGVCALVLLAGCQNAQGISTAPAATPPTDPTLKKDNAVLASAASQAGDPDLCATGGTGEYKIGNLSYLIPLQYDASADFNELYSRVVVTTEICTSNQMGSVSRSDFRKVLNALGISSSKTFSTTIGVIGALDNVKYPDIYPFSYSWDEEKSIWESQMNQQVNLPWQPTLGGYTISYQYKAADVTTIATADLLGGILNEVVSVNPSSAPLSPITMGYMNVGAKVIDKIASKSLTNGTNFSTWASNFDFGASKNRGYIIRFKDTNGAPLAAIKISTALTNTLANPNPISLPAANPGAAPATYIPRFGEYPRVMEIINVPGGGNLGAAISKEQSYKEIIKSNKDTDPVYFSQQCGNLESILYYPYRLNKYDVALVMGDVLRRSAYIKHSPLYTSCFASGKKLLKEMGLERHIAFGAQEEIGVVVVDFDKFCSLRNLMGAGDPKKASEYEVIFLDTVQYVEADGNQYPTSKSEILNYISNTKGKISPASCQQTFSDDGKYTQYQARFTLAGDNDVYEIDARGAQNGKDTFARLESGIGWFRVRKVH